MGTLSAGRCSSVNTALLVFVLWRYAATWDELWSAFNILCHVCILTLMVMTYCSMRDMKALLAQPTQALAETSARSKPVFGSIDASLTSIDGSIDRMHGSLDSIQFNLACMGAWLKDPGVDCYALPVDYDSAWEQLEELGYQAVEVGD